MQFQVIHEHLVGANRVGGRQAVDLLSEDSDDSDNGGFHVLDVRVDFHSGIQAERFVDYLSEESVQVGIDLIQRFFFYVIVGFLPFLGYPRVLCIFLIRSPDIYRPTDERRYYESLCRDPIRRAASVARQFVLSVHPRI